jgi:hypothetical protein
MVDGRERYQSSGQYYCIRFLLTRIAALGSSAQSLAGAVAGGFEIEGGVNAESVLTGAAAAAIAHRPALSAGGLHDQIQTGR